MRLLLSWQSSVADEQFHLAIPDDMHISVTTDAAENSLTSFQYMMLVLGFLSTGILILICCACLAILYRLRLLGLCHPSAIMILLRGLVELIAHGRVRQNVENTTHNNVNVAENGFGCELDELSRNDPS